MEIKIPILQWGNVNAESFTEIKGLLSLQIDAHHLIVEAKKYPEEVVQAIVKKARSLGAKIPTIQKQYTVLQMSCASCASSAQAVLNNQVGVVNAEVNYANTSAQVEYIASLIQPQQLKQALIEGGYDLVIEPKTDVAKIKKDEFKALTQNLIGALLFSIPLFIIGMFYMNMPYANEIMWALATPMVFIFGRKFYIGAWKQLRHRQANMDTLVALSTGTAYLFSVAIMLFPNFFHKIGIHGHVYFEAAGLVIAFILLGKWLEERAKGNTASAIKNLMGLQPKTVTRLNNNVPKEVPIEEVQIGDVLLVKSGEKIAVDGKVIQGNSWVNESMITGEPLPVEKFEGTNVFAGTLNQEGSFQYIADKVGVDTLLAHIIQAIEKAQGSKAPIQKLVDKIASIFVPVVLGIAVLSVLIWLIFGGENALSQAFLAFITVLVIACPCALGLATPTAIMVGIGKAAEKGILIKDAENLEHAQHINALVLDKTGTISEGQPLVNAELWLNPEFKTYLFSIESASQHPLAQAILQHLGNMPYVAPKSLDTLVGKGMRAQFEEQSYWVGNRKLANEYPLNISEEVLKFEQQQIGNTLVYFGNATEFLGILSISDQIKPSSKSAIAQLQAMGIEVHMLTGDNPHSAQAIAQQVGINRVVAEVSPQQKGEYIEQLQAEGKRVGMVGDGINDAQALAQSDISIAMGKGSDIAMDVAKITIISSDLEKIPTVLNLSKFTSKTIRQNLFWAFIYNLIGIPIAAGMLYPINGFMLDPMWAGAAMAFSSVSVVTNSLILKWKKL